MLFLPPPLTLTFSLSSVQYENKDTVLTHSGFRYCIYILVSIIDEMTEWSFCPKLVLAYYKNNGELQKEGYTLKKGVGGSNICLFYWLNCKSTKEQTQ